MNADKREQRKMHNSAEQKHNCFQVVEVATMAFPSRSSKIADLVVEVLSALRFGDCSMLSLDCARSIRIRRLYRRSAKLWET